MAKKLIALLAVLALVVTPLFVIGGGDDAQAADPEKIYFEDINNSSTYWIKGVIDENSNMVLTLNENGKKIPFVANNNPSAEEPLSVSNLVTGEGFGIPKGCIMSGGEATIELYIMNDITIKGLLLNNGSFTIYTKNAVKITFDGTTFDSDIIMNVVDGSSLVCKNGAMITPTLQDTEANSIVSFDHVIGEGNGFTISFVANTNGTKCILSGDMSGRIDGNSEISLHLKSNEFKDTNFKNVKMRLFDSDVAVQLNDSRTFIDYRGSCVFTGSLAAMTNMTCTNGTKNIVYDFIESASSIDTHYVFGSKVSTTGSQLCFASQLKATEGIDNLSDVLMITDLGSELNLNSITVTCEEGYHFIGWYYMDDDGAMCKVMDPEHVILAQGMTFYAMAEQDSPVIPNPPAQKDYTGFFIGIIVLLVLVILAAIVCTYILYNKKTTKR